ncbi:MAG: branched-chain amino acid aminotransferase [Bradymonadales bacterium]|jgi:branched-chain amino acid aminotransferase
MPVISLEQLRETANLGFGKVFSPHMFIAYYDPERGWHDQRIQEYQPISMDPAAPIFHYAQSIFEGLKAYRRPDGEVQIFRAKENVARLNRSAQRMAMPLFDEEENLRALDALVNLDRDWVPSAPGCSLYLRPTMIADGCGLGASSAKRFIYFIICSPSGAYYSKGIAPVSIQIEEKYVRAVKGGTGQAKAAGNYAGSFKATADAVKRGFDQVLWLDGKENRYIEEVGAMNIFFVIEDRLVTPELCGSILPGVTRDSVITLARDFGIEVEERRIDVRELYEAHRHGALREVFGTGTAAVISPVSVLEYKGERIEINGAKIGKLSQRMYDHLSGIQRATIEDKYNWCSVVSRDAKY